VRRRKVSWRAASPVTSAAFAACISRSTWVMPVTASGSGTRSQSPSARSRSESASWKAFTRSAAAAARTEAASAAGWSPAASQ
jgi:hypothetical protein